MEKINASIGFDRKLYAQDIAGSLAHADMLVAQGILTATDGRAIKQGLAKVRAEIESGKFKFSTKLEDIHFNVEARLTELIGPAGGRLHTARSRNDQVALDVRLWMRDDGRSPGGDAARPAGGADRSRRGICRHHHAGLHPPADGAADHLRPSPAGLRRDVRPRPQRASATAASA